MPFARSTRIARPDIQHAATISELLNNGADDISVAGFSSDTSLQDLEDFDNPDEMYEDFGYYFKKPGARK